MAGRPRAAPPMPDPIDPAEFDAPPPADPGADYRVLLDAMRQAGADRIAQQSAALVQRIEQDARPRLEWGQRMGTAVDDLPRVAGPPKRSAEERPVGRECVGMSRSRGSPYPSNKNPITTNQLMITKPMAH